MNKRNIIISLTFISLIADTIAFGHGPQAAADVPEALPQLRYAVIDLGEDAAANGVTDSGRIIGSKNFGGPDRHAAFWPNSQSAAIDLGRLPGLGGSRGYGINPRGEIVGAAFPFSSARPLYWASSQSSPMELPGLPNGFQGLAPAIINNMIDAFAQLKAKGVTILLVEQNINFAKRLGDTVAVMDNGVVVHAGSMGELAGNEELQHSLLGLAL